jgi:hypothetical protein
VNIPDEAVDAAVNALLGSTLGDRPGTNGEEFVEAARAALEAAAPHLMAQAFSEGQMSILATGYRKPYTVTTAAELDALPIGSVVRSSNGTVYERDHVKTNPGDTTWWIETGSDRDHQSSSISLSATVIYEGEE